MSDAIVIASHLPGEGCFESDAFRVAPVVCEDEFSYWRGLAAYWDSSLVLLNVEHDIEVSDEHIAGLLACPHPVCAHVYACHWASTGLQHDVFAAGPGGGYASEGDEWAAWSAIGCVKITPEARVGPLRREPWSLLELAVADAVRGPWHLHWPPLTHHHY